MDRLLSWHRDLRAHEGILVKAMMMDRESEVRHSLQFIEDWYLIETSMIRTFRDFKKHASGTFGQIIFMYTMKMCLCQGTF